MRWATKDDENIGTSNSSLLIPNYCGPLLTEGASNPTIPIGPAEIFSSRCTRSASKPGSLKRLNHGRRKKGDEYESQQNRRRRAQHRLRNSTGGFEIQNPHREQQPQPEKS